MNPALVCLGEPLIEFNQREDGLFVQGIGGDVNNCAIAATRSGLSAGIITALGDDHFATTIRALWRQEGVDDSMVLSDPSHHTGMYFISHDESGHHFSYARRDSAAANFRLTPAHETYIKQANILHISGISLAISTTACDTVYEAIAIAREHGVAVSFDTNYRDKLWPLFRASAVTNHVASLADYVFPGFDDAKALTGLESPQAIAAFYRRNGAAIVALTLGADGVYLDCESFQGLIAAYHVDAVDATAAGDTFDGAFLAAFSNGASAYEATQYANAAAALCVSSYGAINAIPAKQTIHSFQRTHQAYDR